ncbi:MAG: hypothetical protein CM15mP49_23040 [Actinomycetota bacterium]|nr:MAG: hypothetical protein CM15mP49_23040 [Actinomycetota bacterium]
MDAGKGISHLLWELVDVDTRSDLRFVEQGADQLETYLAALGPVIVAEHLNGLDGKTVSIEGFGSHGPAMMDLIAERGGKVVSISTLSGSVSNSDGLDPGDPESVG